MTPKAPLLPATTHTLSCLVHTVYITKKNCWPLCRPTGHTLTGYTVPKLSRRPSALTVTLTLSLSCGKVLRTRSIWKGGSGPTTKGPLFELVHKKLSSETRFYLPLSFSFSLCLSRSPILHRFYFLWDLKHHWPSLLCYKKRLGIFLYPFYSKRRC